MCTPASFVVTKGKVFWSENGDSHEIIIEENKLKEIDVRNNPTFVRVEIVPPNRDYTLPLSKWVYKLDQDIRPEWYDAKDVERRCRTQLKLWRKSNVVMPKESIGSVVDYKAAVYGTIKAVWGGTIKDVWGGTIKAVWGGTIEAVRGGTIEAVWGGTIGFKGGHMPNEINGQTTIIAYTSLSPDILKSSQAVIVDRTQDPVVCFVGNKKKYKPSKTH